MDMRFTLCNMGIELGAVAAYMQPDGTTLDWVKKRTSRTVYETDRVAPNIVRLSLSTDLF